MSYREFIDDWCAKVAELRGGRTDIDRDEGLEIQARAQALVFGDWLEQKRYRALIAYIHSNFDSGQGDEWIQQLTSELARSKDALLLATLWKGVIALRRQAFWRSVDHLRRHPSSDADPTKRKAYTIEALESFRKVMASFSDASLNLWIEEEISLLVTDKKRKSTKPKDIRPIDQAVFWELIATAQSGTGSSGETMQNLIGLLEQFSASQIRKFETILQEKLAECWSWDLWALAYIARGGCSDDAFDYFRAWVVLQGKELFEIAVTDVERFAQLASFMEDPQCEALLGAAEIAYQNVSGKPMKPVKAPRIVPRGQEWKEDTICESYPEFCAKFGYGR